MVVTFLRGRGGTVVYMLQKKKKREQLLDNFHNTWPLCGPCYPEPPKLVGGAANIYMLTLINGSRDLDQVLPLSC